MSTSESTLVESNRSAQQDFQRQLSQYASVLGGFNGVLGAVLGLFGLILAVLVGLGFMQSRQVTRILTSALKSSEDAKQAIEQANEVKTKAEEAVAGAASAQERFLSLGVLTERVQLCLNEVQALFERLDDYKQEDLVTGGEDWEIPSEARMQLHDADAVLVVFDQLGFAGDAARLSGFFSAISVSWRNLGEHERAIARAQRAVALCPTSTEAQINLARSLMYCADKLDKTDPRRSEYLHRADLAINELERLDGTSSAASVHARGWVLDSRGEHAQAIESYLLARARDREEAKRDGRPEDLDITWDLACARCQIGDYDNCLKELDAVLEVERTIRQAETDSDLAALRADPEAGPQFLAMLKKHRDG